MEEKKYRLPKKDDFETELQKSINNIIRKKGYITYSTEIKDLLTNGDNFLGVLYEVNIKGYTAKGDEETNIFVKKRIPDENSGLMLNEELYVRELFFYTELSKVFEELQNEAKISLEDRYKAAKGFEESDVHTIMLENMTKKGYTTSYRMDVVSLKFAELSVQQLAKFHALSFAVEKSRTELYKKIKSFNSPVSYDENEWKLFSSKIYDYTVECLQDECKEKVQEIIMNTRDIWLKYLCDRTSTVCCLCHGDFKVTNILMKEIDNEVKDVIIVDYQVLQYGSPVNDLIYFIFTSTDKEFRQKHLTYLKDTYYETLEKFLKYFDLDVKNIFGREEFDRTFKERLLYGFVTCFVLCPFTFVPEDNAIDLVNESIYSFSPSYDNRMEKRIKGLVEEFQELGYL